ncbi:MAG: hypothetical protein V1889_02010 [archaeon]
MGEVGRGGENWRTFGSHIFGGFAASRGARLGAVCGFEECLNIGILLWRDG